MRITEGFILREVANNFVVVPVGKTSLNFNGMVTLNATGAFLWRTLENDITEEDLIRVLTKKYDVSIDVASKDVREFLDILKSNHLIQE